jgi:LysR substrate binding domain
MPCISYSERRASSPITLTARFLALWRWMSMPNHSANAGSKRVLLWGLHALDLMPGPQSSAISAEAVSSTIRLMATPTAVETRTTELGFVEGAVHGEQLTSTPLARDQVLVVVRPDHPWVERTDLAPTDILDGAWVLRESGSGTRSVFEDALR